MITLSSAQSADFEPLGQVEFEAPRLAALLLGGTAVPPLFTQFVVALASLPVYMSSDLTNNAHYQALRTELLDKDGLFNLEVVYKFWRGEYEYLYWCLEELFLTGWAQYPRLEIEQELKTAAEFEKQTLRVRVMSIDEVAQFIAATQSMPRDSNKLPVFAGMVSQMERLLDLVIAPKPALPAWNRYKRKPHDFKDVVAMAEHVMGVYDIVTQVDAYDPVVLYYLAAAYGRIMLRVGNVVDLVPGQRIEAMESYTCLSRPWELFDLVRKSKLETLAGSEDTNLAYPAMYARAFIHLALIQDLISHSEFLSIAHALGVYPEDSELLVMSQSAFLNGKGAALQ